MDGSGSVADGLELRLMFPAGRDVTVEASGELDLASAHHLRSALVHAATGTVAARVVVDLGGVVFMDSAGAKVLATMAEVLAADGRELVLCRATPAVERVLAVAGFRGVTTVG